MSDWKPIETAPKDGRAFFVYIERIGFPVHCRWDFDKDRWVVCLPWAAGGFNNNDSGEATHWMPMPEAP